MFWWCLTMSKCNYNPSLFIDDHIFVKHLNGCCVTLQRVNCIRAHTFTLWMTPANTTVNIRSGVTKKKKIWNTKRQLTSFSVQDQQTKHNNKIKKAGKRESKLGRKQGQIKNQQGQGRPVKTASSMMPERYYNRNVRFR